MNSLLNFFTLGAFPAINMLLALYVVTSYVLHEMQKGVVVVLGFSSMVCDGFSCSMFLFYTVDILL